MANYSTTIKVKEEQREAVGDAQAQLEDELGIDVTLGETVKIACRRMISEVEA